MTDQLTAEQKRIFEEGKQKAEALGSAIASSIVQDLLRPEQLIPDLDVSVAGIDLPLSQWAKDLILDPAENLLEDGAKRLLISMLPDSKQSEGNTSAPLLKMGYQNAVHLI